MNIKLKCSDMIYTILISKLNSRLRFAYLWYCPHSLAVFKGTIQGLYISISCIVSDY